MAYTLRREEIGDVIVLSLSGRFGQDAAEELLAKVTALAAGARIVVDLSGVEYVSSSAIGCLVQIGVDRGAVIAAPSEAVRRTFELAEVGAFLRVLPGLDQARAAATGRATRAAGQGGGAGGEVLLPGRQEGRGVPGPPAEGVACPEQFTPSEARGPRPPRPEARASRGGGAAEQPEQRDRSADGKGPA